MLNDRPHPAVLAFAAGAVDRGARVQSVSQFPAEVEFTFPPLSYIQPEFVDCEFKVEEITHPSKPEVKVPLIHVRVNANIRSATLEELRMSRKLNHIAAFRSHNRDTKADLQNLCLDRNGELAQRVSIKAMSQEQLAVFMNFSKIRHAQFPVDSVDCVINCFQEAIFQQCEAELLRHEGIPYSAFADKFEHTRLLAEMLSVKKWAIAKLLWFIEDSSQELESMLKYPLQKSYREYVSFCRNRIQQEKNFDAKRSHARALCQLLGLVGSANHDMARDDAPIVQAVENGASALDVDLLLVAGFSVDSVCPSGNSLLCIAARFGYLHVAQALIAQRADVNFANIYDGERTPVMFAASHGHVTCLQLLLDSGARASKEGYQVAMQSGHASCAAALSKADSSCTISTAILDAFCDDQDVPAVFKIDMLSTDLSQIIRHAMTHPFPNEDLCHFGMEAGWPRRCFGSRSSNALVAEGINTFTKLRQLVRSTSKKQFVQNFGENNRDGRLGALGKEAHVIWTLVTIWEFVNSVAGRPMSLVGSHDDRCDSSFPPPPK